MNKIYVFGKENSRAILKFLKCGIETPAYIGKNGLTNKKQEGDGKTPIGEFEIGLVLTRNDALKISNDYIVITNNLYWIDDLKSKYYNQLVDIDKIRKDWSSAEHLIDYPIQYEFLLEIKVNPNNIPGNGSAIFLHCTNGKPTAGCIAVNRNIMKLILENIDENTKIVIS